MEKQLLKQIREIRRKQGLTQTFMATKLGLDYSTYGKLERGKISLNVDRLGEISKILNISIQIHLNE